MFVQTSHQTYGPDDTVNVYRDRDASPRIAVIHTSAHRGGCLYIGSVQILNQDTGQSYTFSTTAAPYAINAESAAAYAARHAARVI